MTDSAPVTDPSSNRAGHRLIAGTVLLIAALSCIGFARLVSGTQRHAYNPHANPAAAYQVTAGRTYQLSTPGGVAGLQRAGVLVNGIALACTMTGDDGVQTPLNLQRTLDDPRDLHVFATWQATMTGSFRFSCGGVPEVFVDDADNSATDYGGAATVLACVLGVLGVALLCSGAYELSENRASA